MSDDESFVIVGTSPLSSLDVAVATTESPVERAADVVDVIRAQRADPTPLNSPSASLKINKSATNSLKGSNSLETGNDIVAANLILGEINADGLKTSVYSQFPSQYSKEACAEDVVKLQNLMSEYIELKISLTMKQFYNKTQQWKEEHECKEQLMHCQSQISALRNQNLELTRDINTKIEQVQICDEVRQSEHKQLMQNNSEKSAVIENLRVHNEHHQLASFENVPKNDSKEKPDDVGRVIKDFERQLSEHLAENLELKYMQKNYIDEINCLKVNLTAAEKLTQQSRTDIGLINANNMEKSKTLREEMSALRQQVAIYRKDFEMERVARQNLVGEKNQLLQDLSTLTDTRSLHLPSFVKPAVTDYSVCQICSKYLKTPF